MKKKYGKLDIEKERVIKKYFTKLHLYNSDIFFHQAKKLMNSCKTIWPPCCLKNPLKLLQIGKDEGVVVIGNHGFHEKMSRTPQLFLSYFPLRMHPWKRVFKFTQKFFVRGDLKVPCIFSVPATLLFAPWMIGLGVGISSIKVQRRDIDEKNWSVEKREEMYDKTIELLELGRHILIMPENSYKGLVDESRSKCVNKFYKGFVRIGEKYFLRTGKKVKFLPVALHDDFTFECGDFVVFDEKNFESNNEAERERLLSTLENSLVELTKDDGKYNEK